jgi:hypothetical protein
MPKRSSKTRPIEDLNETAFRVVWEATESEDQPSEDEPSPPKKNPHAVALGRKGGKKGGRARAEKLTPRQRSDIARRAAQVRWQKERQKK